MLTLFFILGLLLLPTPGFAEEPSSGTLTLDEALRIARENQPQLRQARAGTEAAQARADQVRAPLLPQVNGTASYQRSTANPVPRAGTSSSALIAPPSRLDTFNFFNFGVGANQLLYDFGQTTGRLKAARASAEAEADFERATRLQVDLTVRTTYFNARAAKALMQVAKESLANQDRHFGQISAFVEVGTRPEIDLAQARTDRANTRVQLINAENAYETAKAQLNQAMGIEGSTGYDVVDETLPALDNEDLSLDLLLEEATAARPELTALSNQVRAQEFTLRSVENGYMPSLSLSTGLTRGGTELGNLAWNWEGGVLLSWPLFQGGLTRAQGREARANLTNVRSQADIIRQQVRLEVDEARLTVRAAKAAIGAANEALINGAERLRLAEKRYETGVGNIIELEDAQLALFNAEAQKVQAEYNLSAARARLLKALGRI
jgi:outer membrane protein